MKTRNIRKYASLLMVSAMLLSLFTILVSALPDSLPDPTHLGSITLHKYLMDDLSEATVPGDGTVADPADIPASASPLEGITFNIVRVLDDSTDPATATAIVGAGEFADSGETDVNGEILWDDLAHGVYLITEAASDKVATPAAPFLVSVPMTNQDDPSQWLYDIHVYPKNGSFSIDKFVVAEPTKTTSTDINEVFPWQIKALIPIDIVDAQSFGIVDVLDSQLTYVGNVVLSGEKSDGTKETIPVGAEGSENYTITAEVNGLDAFQLDVVFTAEGRTLLGDYKYVSVFFDTFINDTATLGEEIFNGATLSYRNSSGVYKETGVEDEPETHTGGVLIEKVEKNDNSVKLGGAEFKIALTQDNIDNDLFIRIDGSNNLLRPGDTGYDAATDWVITTDDTTGQATFAGLAYGSYLIVETKAPVDAEGDAYNLLKAPIAVTVNDASHTDANKIVVENSKGFELPLTGGTGTTIFTICGIVIMGTACLFLFKSKKKNAKN